MEQITQAVTETTTPKHLKLWIGIGAGVAVLLIALIFVGESTIFKGQLRTTTKTLNLTAPDTQTVSKATSTAPAPDAKTQPPSYPTKTDITKSTALNDIVNPSPAVYSINTQADTTVIPTEASKTPTGGTSGIITRTQCEEVDNATWLLNKCVLKCGDGTTQYGLACLTKTQIDTICKASNKVISFKVDGTYSCVDAQTPATENIAILDYDSDPLSYSKDRSTTAARVRLDRAKIACEDEYFIWTNNQCDKSRCADGFVPSAGTCVLERSDQITCMRDHFIWENNTCNKSGCETGYNMFSYGTCKTLTAITSSCASQGKTVAKDENGVYSCRLTLATYSHINTVKCNLADFGPWPTGTCVSSAPCWYVTGCMTEATLNKILNTDKEKCEVNLHKIWDAATFKCSTDCQDHFTLTAGVCLQDRPVGNITDCGIGYTPSLDGTKCVVKVFTKDSECASVYPTMPWVWKGRCVSKIAYCALSGETGTAKCPTSQTPKFTDAECIARSAKTPFAWKDSCVSTEVYCRYINNADANVCKDFVEVVYDNMDPPAGDDPVVGATPPVGGAPAVDSAALAALRDRAAALEYTISSLNRELENAYAAGNTTKISELLALLTSTRQQQSQVVVNINTATQTATAQSPAVSGSGSAGTTPATVTATKAKPTAKKTTLPKTPAGASGTQTATDVAAAIDYANQDFEEVTVPTTKPVASNVASTSRTRGAYIQGNTGPELLLYPIFVMAANGLYYVSRKRRK